MVLNSLNFYLSVKLLISPSYLNEILAGYSNLGCRFFSLITLSMSCHFLLWNNAVTEIKITLEGTNSRITEAEDRISEAEDKIVEINEAERKKELKEMRTTSETCWTMLNAPTFES